MVKLTPEEQMSYISSIDRKRDYINTSAYAKKEGQKEGQKHAEAKAYAEKLASARKMLSKGIDEEDICDVLGLSKEEIEKLK
ncbi:hypothetical protein [Sphingobacterium sp. UDSM-2020]|uniref:hypothetical protein n=1 Tax=Sphingobacterium TaxID=28453 RepID=UPI001937E748|nr:hypothetical protein [Sphingobacterium sp. UDSM-2020]QQD13988.1 hypothetical protein JAZ75_00120 [Sphingobacterium sp. UDSM-2020]